MQKQMKTQNQRRVPGYLKSRSFQCYKYPLKKQADILNRGRSSNQIRTYERSEYTAGYLQQKKLRINAKHCTSLWSQLRGLMFSKPKILVFHMRKPQRIGLHMLFVFFPIDVFILDKKKHVIEIKQNFKPWTFWTSKEKACFVVETPRGGIHAKIKDKLIFK